MTTNLYDYITQSKLFRTFAVDDLLFVEYKCLVEDKRAPIWAHQNYFAYVLGGQKKWKTQDGDYLVGSKEALFVQKGAHTVYQYFEEPFFVLFVFVPDDFIRQVLSKHPEIAGSLTMQQEDMDTVLPVEVNSVLEAFFQSLFSFFMESRPPHRALLKLKLEELVLQMILQPGNTSFKQYCLRLGSDSKIQLEQLMLQHYRFPLSIEEYARLSARSVSTFRRDFKAIFKTTPAKWLLQKRLAYAKFLLETSAKPILDIVEESGFVNRPHFVKLFKKHYGLSPGQTRNASSQYLDA